MATLCNVPSLPVELEREIFEMAFDPDDAVTNVRMTMVARRVREWIRPNIYRVFDTHTDPMFPDFDKYPKGLKLEELGKSFAKCLVLWTHLPNASVLLEGCPNLEILFINHSYLSSTYLAEAKLVLSLLDKLTKLRELHTTWNFGDLPQEQLSGPAFAKITHLKLNVATNWPASILRTFNSLTHLVVQVFRNWEPAQQVLAICPALEVLVLIPDGYVWVHIGESFEDMFEHITDPRMVLLSPRLPETKRYAQKPTRGGVLTTWSAAEIIVTCRKRKYFEVPTASHKPIHSLVDWAQGLTEEGAKYFASATPNCKRRFSDNENRSSDVVSSSGTFTAVARPSEAHEDNTCSDFMPEHCVMQIYLASYHHLHHQSMMDATLPEPSFPVELEQKIFEMAFDPTDQVTNVRMTLVARRVLEWIRPLIFRVIDTYNNPVFPNFDQHKDSLKLEDIGRYVKCLILGIRVESITPLFENYLNTESVHIPCSYHSIFSGTRDSMSMSLLSLTKLPRLRQLDVDWDILKPVVEILLLSQVFGGLTHLHLQFNLSKDDRPTHVLKACTSLTHVALRVSSNWNHLQEVLNAVPRVKVFVLIALPGNDWWNNRNAHWNETPCKYDSRVVCLSPEIRPFGSGWYLGRQIRRGLGPSVWEIAESNITCRRRKYVKAGPHLESEVILSLGKFSEGLTEEGRKYFAPVLELHQKESLKLRVALSRSVFRFDPPHTQSRHASR